MRFSSGLVLFDAAGTLIETAEPVEKVYAEFFRKHGWEVGADRIRGSFSEAFRAVEDPDFGGGGDGDLAERRWWREVVDRIGTEVGLDRDGDAFETCFGELFHHYAEGAAWRAYPEAAGVLEDLRGRGLRLAVVSNFDRRLHRVLEDLDLARFFDLVLTSADVGARKPSPLLLREALSRLGEPAEGACLTGDSRVADGGAAAAAGVGFFLLDRPRTDLRDFVRWLDEDFSQNELA